MSSITLLNTHKIPTVFYTAKAWNTIQFLIHEVTTEIGWWQMVERMSDGNYLLTETIVPEQTVSGGEADITKDDLAIAGDALLAAGHDTSKLNAWGHSHVMMGCTPSGQDKTQALAYKEDIPFLIRGIYNKKGEARVDVLDFEKGILFNEVPNFIYTPPLSDEDKEYLGLLIKQNVKTKVFSNSYNRNYNSNFAPQTRHPNINGVYIKGIWTPFSETEMQAREEEEKKLNPILLPYSDFDDSLNDYYKTVDWPSSIGE